MKELCIQFKNLIVISLIILLFHVVIYVLFDKNKEGFGKSLFKSSINNQNDGEISNGSGKIEKVEISYNPEMLNRMKSSIDNLLLEKNTIVKETKDIEEKTKTLNKETEQIRERIVKLQQVVF